MVLLTHCHRWPLCACKPKPSNKWCKDHHILTSMKPGCFIPAASRGHFKFCAPYRRTTSTIAILDELRDLRAAAQHQEPAMSVLVQVLVQLLVDESVGRLVVGAQAWQRLTQQNTAAIIIVEYGPNLPICAQVGSLQSH